MLKTNISDQERNLLQQYSKTSPLHLVRQKCYTVLIADQGLNSEAIANVIGKTKRSVNRWIKDWNDQRMASIFTGHKDNENAAKLTKQQKEQIKRALEQPPSEYGLPREFWDVPQLRSYVEATFGTVYDSDKSYHFLLKFSELSFKYPDVFDRKRDETLIAERMQIIKQDVSLLLRRDDWEVFAVDEVRMDQEAIIRKAWLKKGKKTVIKVDRKKQSQSYIGFLNQKTFTCHLHEIDGRQNSANVLKAVEQFLKTYPNKRIAIVWDNAPFHKSKQIKEELKKGGIMERVHLIAMPPYAPDENPIEKVWGTTKRKIANIQQETFQDTRQAFSDYVASRRFRYSF